MKEKKYTTRFLVIAIVLSVLATLLLASIGYAFFSEWNIHGVSKLGPHFDYQSGKTELVYVGDCKGTPVYSYGMKSMYYLSLNANEISMEDYLKYKWVDVKDLIQGGYGITEIVDDTTVYVFQGHCVIPTKKAIVFCADDREPSEAIQKLKKL